MRLFSWSELNWCSDIRCKFDFFHCIRQITSQLSGYLSLPEAENATETSSAISIFSQELDRSTQSGAGGFNQGQSGAGGFNQGQSGAGGFNQGQSGAGGFNQGQSGAGGFNQGQSGAGGYDPPQIVAKALLCFNDKYIYSSCEESYRLTESGNLEVPSEKTDEYCSGPCLTETNLVLSCIDNIFSHFVFYNRATIEEVRETVQAGCGYGPERGDFNVEEHIESEENNAGRFAYQTLVGLGFMLITHGVLML